ncbi:MAG: hypothetical protein KatS3mg008_0696 [Acidimicrobiales bacterium]|nr:MAG: hypothetical protein KatS3mg008_0696 [Acidimicrobiales bacterium]
MGASATDDSGGGTFAYVAEEGYLPRHPARRLLDVMLIATVPPEELIPRPRQGTRWIQYTSRRQRPVSGTIAVDVRERQDRELLQRILRTGEVLSVTSADGWTQRLRLAAVRDVAVEHRPDGETVVVATYTWIAAESAN